MFGIVLLGHLHDQQSGECGLRTRPMSPVEALQSATIVAARMMRQAGRIGELVAGAWAELLIVGGDPTLGLSMLTRPEQGLRLITQAGRTVVDRLAAGTRISADRHWQSGCSLHVVLSKMDKSQYTAGMRQITSSHAKQNFGELLDALADGPVAIERHKKVKAIVCSPEAFLGRATSGRVLAERQEARATQMLVDKDRLIKHQQLAVDLLLMSEVERMKLIRRAGDEVARWRRDRLCSSDYVDRWEELLGLPVEHLARSLGSDLMGWGTALRQNSPWHVVLP